MVMTMKILIKLKGAGIILLAIVLFVLSMRVPAQASSTIDMNRLGSITIDLSDDNSNDNEYLSGIQFTVYKVAKLSNSGDYSLTEEFFGSGVQIDQLSTAAELSAASKAFVSYVSAKNISGSSNVTNSEGRVTFHNLTLGYYLVMQTVTSSNPNYYIACDPFLVPVPIKSSDHKNWIYHMNAYPKKETLQGAVIIEKVNSSSTLLPGAIFRLEKKIYNTDVSKLPSGVITGIDTNGSYYWHELISTLTTNSNGQIAINNMQFGHYRIIETKAPNGYLLNTSPYEFSITAAGRVKLVSGKYVTESGTVQTIKVLNTTDSIYYYNTPTPVPVPSPTPTPTPVLSPTLFPSPTGIPRLTPSPTSPEEINIDDEEIPLDTPKDKVTPSVTPKITKAPTGFDLPKTGGSVAYAVCTYGGMGLMVCGAAVFVISRIKKP